MSHSFHISKGIFTLYTIYTLRIVTFNWSQPQRLTLFSLFPTGFCQIIIWRCYNSCILYKSRRCVNIRLYELALHYTQTNNQVKWQSQPRTKAKWYKERWIKFKYLSYLADGQTELKFFYFNLYTTLLNGVYVYSKLCC